jgi:hypothetical protein
MGAQRERAARYFAEELGKIKDESIREFVLQCFDVAAPYFWERAASSSGKYHPEFTLGSGGLAKHVRYACYWYDQLSRAILHDGKGGNEIDPWVEVDGQKVNLYDIGMGALLVHDCVKDGDPARTIPKAAHKIGGYHGVEMMEAIRERVLPGKTATVAQMLVMYGVAAHMGRWTIPFDFSPFRLKGSAARKLALLVHLGDYCASRRLDEVVPGLARSNP